jgi:hypothetical protein
LNSAQPSSQRTTSHATAILTADSSKVVHYWPVRLSEFWQRMDAHFGSGYARSWASDYVVEELDGRTVEQALAQGESAKTVWRAVCACQPVHAALR